MDNRNEVRDFLTTRRERLTPEQAGVPLFGGKRRVKGLRREEVAMLAGMSTDYYTRLERGNLTGVSASVLESLARALHLDEAERAHLLDLADAANTSDRAAGRPRRALNRTGVRVGVQRILDTINAPAYARNGRMDILAVNRLGRALFAGAYGAGFNLARYLFLDTRSQGFYRDWPTVARDCAAALRTEAGRNPYDRGLTDLVGELSTRSEQFRTWWATHNVKLHHTATKMMHHPVAGDLELTGEALHLPGDSGLTIITYTFEPASPTEQALTFLAGWSPQEAATDTR
ncbi:helix-turn-helix transcriptional regulator [Micromonospora sp. DT46]|uniref:helix-turn-helix transcriptional regulator n=1 Tax=unclassified Micromonospora TaxID=2617518 RepID=UPI00124B8A6F|nr:helix-turn-helix transcriptional regulator [Micromonospora sp. AMSO12t]KAB1138669.1 helix-turn-helix domain-containing protein [Micromonospora sp. AMSO12t]